ncbi:hypothetical protein [Methanosarcina sp. Kolksee]|uniref:hypothetical protein n=1 Tax=Methanosarcina sp. Kolksee TaxID=1434099 RepID=UPI00064F1864|nr:hypothetical protein [Methanosarcina sp. Kolksee]
MQVTARFEKRLHILVMVGSVLNIVLIVKLYTISGDWIQLGAIGGWLAALMYAYLVLKKYPHLADTENS